MSHRFINWAIALAILIVMAAVQQLDPHDFESDAVKERREWMTAIQHCKKLYRVETSVEIDESGNKVCVTRRGEVLPWI